MLDTRVNLEIPDHGHIKQVYLEKHRCIHLKYEQDARTLCHFLPGQVETTCHIMDFCTWAAPWPFLKWQIGHEAAEILCSVGVMNQTYSCVSSGATTSKRRGCDLPDWALGTCTTDIPVYEHMAARYLNRLDTRFRNSSHLGCFPTIRP